MGALRTIFGIIFILYGLSMLINGGFIVLGMDQPITINPAGTEEATVVISQLIPVEMYGFITILWGLLWLFIGYKVATGGKPKGINIQQ